MLLSVKRIIRKKINNARAGRLKRLGWRFIFPLALLFVWLNLFVSVNFVKKYLFAENDAVGTVRIYPFGQETDNQRNEANDGWFNPEKALQEADLGPHAGALNFSDENSAFYIGGKRNLVLGAFEFLRDSGDTGDVKADEIVEDLENVIKSEEESEIVEDEAIKENEIVGDLENEGSGNIEEEIAADGENPEIDGGDLTGDEKSIVEDSEIEGSENRKDAIEDEAAGNENGSDSVSDSGEDASEDGMFDENIESEGVEVLEMEESLKVEVFEPVSSENPGAIDVISEAEASAANETGNESAPEPVLPAGIEPLSFIFGAQSAKAQEFAAENIERLEDFGAFAGAKLMFSFALAMKPDAVPEDESEKITIWYSTENSASEEEIEMESGEESSDQLIPEAVAVSDPLAGRLWEKLDTLTASELSNQLNGGYFSYPADFVNSWEEARNLKIRFEGLSESESDFLFYLDSVWIEAQYDRSAELEKLKKRERWESALALLSEKTVFALDEQGEFKFKYKKNEEHFWETLAGIAGLGDFWRNVDIRADIIDPSGQILDSGIAMVFGEDGEFTLRLPEKKRDIVPGEYAIRFYIVDNSGAESETIELVQKFSWGVLAFNLDKSGYQPGDEAYLQFAVLDAEGHTVCDADLTAQIETPAGDTIILQTGSDAVLSRIEKSADCGPDNVTNKPDYYAYFRFDRGGDYRFTITANSAAGEKSVSETITVEETPAFSVRRSGPTRIWPKADYGMRVSVFADEDFSGDIIESVPQDFKIFNFQFSIFNQFQNFQFFIEDSDEGKRIIIKDVTLKAGEVLDIDYVFDAPDRSPELYLLGPLEAQIENQTSKIENRTWQIASDSFAKRARTVMFQAGVYNDVAAGTGQNTNTDYTLSAFNWKLAESGVSIKNAYIVMEAQFEAYNNTGVAYSGYKLGFDACEETCTAAALGAGGGQVIDDNANTVVYDDTESNVGRFLLDVTNEAQIAAYTGDSKLMESQFGYRLKNSSAYSSIANASAMLVVTYTFDIDSSNITNTVTYPMDSTSGATDYGSMQASQAACTADSNCPTFAYNMELPEWGGVATSTNRVSQWFKMNLAPTANTTTDLRPYLDIQTYNVNSTNVFHYEEALSGNGNTPPAYFPDWANSGYAENRSQQAELYVNATNFALGGEVSETYIASSSASVKTRTVSFPMGVITNGNTVALNSQTATVYFPENGSVAGTVDIKSAWIRLTIHGHTTSGTTYNAIVSTKTGNNATSGNLTYQYRSPVSVVNPITNIVHIIPASDYAELENATATSGKAVFVNLTYSNAVFNGASAELMITYTYSSENSGYLTNLKLFGGQAAGAPATSTVLSTANAVFPEAANKTVLAAGLLSHYLTSDSAAAMGTGAYLSKADLSASSPNCSAPTYRAVADSVNLSGEMMTAVTGAMTTENNRAYYACYARDITTLASDVNKMNGQLIYTYGWTNSRPTGSFNSAVIRRNASGIVDLEIEVDDADDHDVRAKLEFATGTACVFAPSGDPALDETDINITADYADPYIENDNTYQIGTANGYIKTASGSNSVAFDWLARESLGAVDGTYCLRLTANDSFIDQAVPATTTLYIDTLAPTVPGVLALYSRTGTSITLNFGATSTENNFNEYKIFYKIADGTDPKETDSVWASTSDINLYNKLFNNKATTTINTGLIGSTTYSFAIWAYDTFGNKASSSRVDIMTNDAPSGSFNIADTKQRTDGSGIVDISIEADDLNDHDQLIAKIEYEPGSSCLFAAGNDPALDEDSAKVSADFGLPLIENDNEYQIGNTGGWIMTSPGSNTISFDWFAKQDEEATNGAYCLRLTLHDSFDIQVNSATTLITLDNVNPVSAGALSSDGASTDSINLVYDTINPGSDTNEPSLNAYRIFYKKTQSGVTMNDAEIDRTDFDAYDFNGATSTIVSGLDQDSWYVFNIWTFDAFGNMATGTETAIKTDATIKNESLTFVNPRTEGASANIAAILNGEEWLFRASVSETSGYLALNNVSLRFANSADNSSPYSDLAFTWNQSGNTFVETGVDAGNSAVLSAASSANCADNACILDFRIVFNKNFLDPMTEYAAELYSTNDIGTIAENAYANFYQVRFPFVQQTHYRWRNDDGGE